MKSKETAESMIPRAPIQIRQFVNYVLLLSFDQDPQYDMIKDKL